MSRVPSSVGPFPSRFPDRERAEICRICDDGIRIETVQTERHTLVRVEGRLGWYEGTLLEDTVAVFDRAAAVTVVDLTRAEIVETGGLDPLVRLGEWAELSGKPVYVAGLSSRMWTLLLQCDAVGGLEPVDGLHGPLCDTDEFGAS